MIAFKSRNNQYQGKSSLILTLCVQTSDPLATSPLAGQSAQLSRLGRRKTGCSYREYAHCGTPRQQCREPGSRRTFQHQLEAPQLERTTEQWQVPGRVSSQ